jgi:hypothetical protein
MIAILCDFAVQRYEIYHNVTDNSSFFVPLYRNVRPEVAKAIILPSVEVSKSAVPSAVA